LRIPDGVTLGLASELDLDELAELSFASHGPGAGQAPVAAAREVLRREFAGQDGTLIPEASITAVVRDRIVAAILTVESPPPAWDMPDGPTVLDMFVVPDWRGRGIALAMMVAAAQAVEAGTDSRQLSLRVQSTNGGALALYARLGFEGVDRTGRAAVVRGLGIAESDR